MTLIKYVIAHDTPRSIFKLYAIAMQFSFDKSTRANYYDIIITIVFGVPKSLTHVRYTIPY